MLLSLPDDTLTINERLKNGRLKVKRLQLKKSEKGIERLNNLLFPLLVIVSGKTIKIPQNLIEGLIFW